MSRYQPELTGTLALMRPILKRWLRKQRTADTERLKQLLESNRRRVGSGDGAGERGDRAPDLGAFQRDDGDTRWHSSAQTSSSMARAAVFRRGNLARGIPAVRETFEAWDAEAWEETGLNPQEFIDAGDQVVVLQHDSDAAAVAAWRSSPKPQSSSNFATDG